MEEPHVMPPEMSRVDWQHAVWKFRDAEKEHMRRGDALAARRRRLPMTRLPEFQLTGADGKSSLLDAFEGRRQLVTYQFMWRDNSPVQCEGCTLFLEHFAGTRYLHARDTTLAVITRGPWQEAAAYRAKMGWTMPWYSSPDLASYLLEPNTSFTLTAFITDGENVFQTYVLPVRACRSSRCCFPSHGSLMWYAHPGREPYPTRYEVRGVVPASG
jgi:predicted dithiol-disulfide oxidoreductase (DUF899 family)